MEQYQNGVSGHILMKASLEVDLSSVDKPMEELLEYLKKYRQEPATFLTQNNVALTVEGSLIGYDSSSDQFQLSILGDEDLLRSKNQELYEENQQLKKSILQRDDLLQSYMAEIEGLEKALLANSKGDGENNEEQ